MEVPEVTIYIDFMSQPSRSIVNFLTINKIPHKIVEVLISKGKTKSKEFLKINPHGTVPTAQIKRGNEQPLILYESCTILRCLAETFNVDEHWYNRLNLNRRYLIDQYLDWHHSNTRKFCAGTIFPEYFQPYLEKQLKVKLPPSISERSRLPKLMEYLDSEFSKHEFIIDNDISIADYMLYNEVNQLSIINYDISSYVNLSRFMKSMSERDEVKKADHILLKSKSRATEKPKF